MLEQLPQTLLALPFRRLPLLAGLGLLLFDIFSLASTQEVAPTAATVAENTTRTMRRDPLVVTTIADGGEGSLRQAIVAANTREGPDTIRFDSTTGPFGTPQTITLASGLPDLIGELTIDGYIKDRLWKPSGVTVSGGNVHRVLTVVPGARVTVSFLTIAEGRATQGGGIANQGDLVVKGVTFKDNIASQDGGGIANLGGTLTVFNSTFVDNEAGKAGGGLANHTGRVTVTNCTFSNNKSPKGGGLFSAGILLLRNTILANSEDGVDCAAAGVLDPASTHNLIEANAGCGTPISTADPRFERLGGYNGPTPTLPLGGRSAAINLGDNASAVDERGQPLRWDQRGNGDPRLVGGIADIGAFEVQAVPKLVVDTVEDTELRACRGGRPDCSLRGAIALANATPGADVIRFDAKVFSEQRPIIPMRPLPPVEADLTLDGSPAGGVRVQGEFAAVRAAQEARLILQSVVFEADE